SFWSYCSPGGARLHLLWHKKSKYCKIYAMSTQELVKEEVILVPEAVRTRGRLARFAIAAYRKIDPATPPRLLINPNLAERQITELDRVQTMLEQAEMANTADLRNIAPGERVIVMLKRYREYGHVRELLLEKQPALKELEFTVTGDDPKIHENTD